MVYTYMRVHVYVCECVMYMCIYVSTCIYILPGISSDCISTWQQVCVGECVVYMYTYVNICKYTLSGVSSDLISTRQRVCMWKFAVHACRLLHLECHFSNLKSQSIVYLSTTVVPRFVEKRTIDRDWKIRLNDTLNAIGCTSRRQ